MKIKEKHESISGVFYIRSEIRVVHFTNEKFPRTFRCYVLNEAMDEQNNNNNKKMLRISID